ncbi:MAG: ECF transporter S component [Bacilli bacterium]|nr:ECF transporter S component [Bacilli bacterium]MBQ8218825.1 ECF transporter S component [Bacilli bacterium]
MNKTKYICITALGIALFVVLSMCLRVPIFENYYICLGYIVMTIYLYNVGTLSGTIVGCLGTFIYCILINGLRGMPGWILGNIVIGLLTGFAMKTLNTNKNWVNYMLISIISIISVAIGILLVKSFVEYILYSQPILIRIITNMSAFITDCITIILSIPLAIQLKKPFNNIISN